MLPKKVYIGADGRTDMFVHPAPAVISVKRRQFLPIPETQSETSVRYMHRMAAVALCRQTVLSKYGAVRCFSVGSEEKLQSLNV